MRVERHDETLPGGDNDTEQEKCDMSVFYCQLLELCWTWLSHVTGDLPDDGHYTRLMM